MDWNIITQLITSIGFPIMACVVLFRAYQNMDEKHSQEIEKMSDALNNNTLALQKLIDKIGGDN